MAILFGISNLKFGIYLLFGICFLEFMIRIGPF